MKRKIAAIFLTTLIAASTLSGCVPQMTQKISVSKGATPLSTVTSDTEESYEPTVKENSRDLVKKSSESEAEELKEKEAQLNPVDMSSDVYQILSKLGVLNSNGVDLSTMTNEKLMDALLKAGYEYKDFSANEVTPGTVLISSDMTAVTISCSNDNCTLYTYSKDGSFEAKTLPRESLEKQEFDKMLCAKVDTEKGDN